MSKIKNTQINRQNLNWLLEQPLDVKVDLVANHMEICRIVINSILESEVEDLAGMRYSHEKPNGGQYSRWGSNPGSIRLGNQKIRLSVPRVMDKKQKQNVTLKSYPDLQELPDQEEQMVQSVLRGLSMRDYNYAVESLYDSFGLSASSVSRRFKEQSARALEEFEKRQLGHHTFVALFIDGKSLLDQQMVLVLGVTEYGEKLVLGVLQTATENAISIGNLLKDIRERGFTYEGGLLCVIDGAKGIRKALEDNFSDDAIIQRCQWHKRENVVSYLPESEQITVKGRLQKIYREPDYKEAKRKIADLHADLLLMNRAAANSLKEGLEETLTLQRLGMLDFFGKSFTTTNCIESVNSALEKYTGKIKRWVNSDQRYRWVVMGVLAHEKRMRKVDNYKKLFLLKAALKNEIENRKKNLFKDKPEKISTKNAT